MSAGPTLAAATQRRQPRGAHPPSACSLCLLSNACSDHPAYSMPPSRRGGAPGPDPHLLFAALLTRNCSWAAQLLLGSQAQQQLSHEGPAGISSLHAAVVGGCAGQLLAVVAAGESTIPGIPALLPLPTYVGRSHMRTPAHAGTDLNGALGASACPTMLLCEPPDSPAGQLAEFLDRLGGARLDWRRIGSALSEGNTPLAVAVG